MDNKIIASEGLQQEIKRLIILLRRKKEIAVNWSVFQKLINENLKEICSTTNTRWLVSIADTYADYGNSIEKRNAMFISILINMEKLFSTRLLIYDLSLNMEKVEKIKKEKVFPLWDGVTSFNIVKGDMTNNLFLRLRSLMKPTPILARIFETVLQRMAENNSTLADINKFHHKVFKSPNVIEQYWKNLRKNISRIKI
jgi:hypothetical protein